MQHVTLETLQEAGYVVWGPTQHTFRLNPERPAGLTNGPEPLGSGYYALIDLDDGNKLAVMVDVQENVAANREEYPYTGTLYVGKETNGSLADAHEGVIDDCCGVVRLSAPFDYGDETVILELEVFGSIHWQDHPTTLEGVFAVLAPWNARVGHLPETGEAFVLYSYSRNIVLYTELDDIHVWQDIDGDGVVRYSTPGESARASDAVLIGSTKAWEIHSVSPSGKTVRLLQKQTNTPAPDTIVVPAPFEHAMVNVSESDPPHYFLDLVSVLPNTCQTFDGIEVERSGTEITVSITNRAPGGDRSDCEWVSRFMTHSVALGTDFTPGVTYTVRVNGVPGPPILNVGPGERGGVTHALGDDHVALTFVGRSAPVAVEQPVSGTVAVAAYTHDVVGVGVNDSRPPQHFLKIQSAVIGCGKFDRIEVDRSGDNILVSVTNRRPVEGNCTSAGLSYTTHSVSVGTDFEPSVTYTVRVNVRDDSRFTLFSGWLGYDRIGNYDTVEVPATIKSLAVSHDVAGRRYLDIVSGLPNTCSEFGGVIVEQTGTEITVSVTNRVVADSCADCARLSRSTESFSVLLGTNFEPGVTYTVHVNDVTTTFGGRPPLETYSIPAPIESATVTVAESDPPQYFLDIASGLPYNRCVLFDQVSIRRSGTDIYIFVRYQAPYSNYVPCLDAPPPPQVHSVALGSDFEPGVKYTVRVNDFWTGQGMAPPPDTVSTTFVAAAPTSTPSPTPTPTPEPTRVPTSESTAASDREILVEFYHATGGPNWEDNTNWLSTAPIGQWHGVSTDPNGRVVDLVLGENRLSGDIPPALSNLANLQVMYIANNELSGEIPSELGRLRDLWLLALSGNTLSGCVPQGLRYVLLNDFHDLGLPFCGPPTPTVSDSMDREALVALYNATDGANWTNNDNWLSDAPMGEWYGVTVDSNGRVIGLDLYNTELRGAVPPELGSLTALQALSLENNSLSGEIPQELGNLTALQALNLRDNRLSGEIPSELSNLINLKALALGGNQLSGEIPSWLGSLRNLSWLFLDDNLLSGELPPELGSIANLRILFLSDNRLSGEIPPEFGNITHLSWLFLSGNELSGCMPDSLLGVPENDFLEFNPLPCSCGDN